MCLCVSVCVCVRVWVGGCLSVGRAKTLKPKPCLSLDHFIPCCLKSLLHMLWSLSCLLCLRPPLHPEASGKGNLIQNYEQYSGSGYIRLTAAVYKFYGTRVSPKSAGLMYNPGSPNFSGTRAVSFQHYGSGRIEPSSFFRGV